MSFLDKAKNLAGKNPDKIKDGLDKVTDKVDSATGGKYSDQIKTAKDKAGDFLGDDKQQGQQGQGGQQGQQGQGGQQPGQGGPQGQQRQ